LFFFCASDADTVAGGELTVGAAAGGELENP
jgi:hypothetical protein